MVYITALQALKPAKIIVYLSQIAQIVEQQWDKIYTKIIGEYSDFTNEFSSVLVNKLLKNIEIDNIIKLMKDKQSLYGFIYAFSTVELEVFKIYMII